MTDQPQPTTALRKWADKAMFIAEPQETTESGVVPDVTLLWMTPDPFGAIAAMTEMYKGRVVRSLQELTDDERRAAFADATATHLTTPLEAVKFQFLFEGVDRAFTQQLERQRIASYAEQSLRFAVVEDLLNATTRPPSLDGTHPLADEEDKPGWLPPTGEKAQRQRWRNTWDDVIMTIQQGYEDLVNDGMPAEDARGLLPLSTATRVIYNTDLKSLVHHSGNRLCTQAQFVWRMVFSQIVQEIRNYCENGHAGYFTVGQGNIWQFEALGTSALFRPACYQLGHCPWNASFDRGCTIKERVGVFAENGVPSNTWDEATVTRGGEVFGPINPSEWLLNPAAARTPYGGRQ